MGKVKTGGNTRKRGRMKVWCAAYANRQQRERNKTRRLRRHLAAHPADTTATRALESLPEFNR